MLEINKKASELSEVELKKIPSILLKMTLTDTGSVVHIPFGDLEVYKDLDRRTTLSVIDTDSSWDTIRKKTPVLTLEMPLRLFFGVTNNERNYRGVYCRYELISKRTKKVIQGFLPDAVYAHIKDHKLMTKHWIIVASKQGKEVENGQK